jgi:ferredoxin
MILTTSQSAATPAARLDPGPDALPSLPTAVKDAKATREQMFTLRHFHLGDPGAGGQLESIGDDWLPALLNPYRDTNRLRYNYPLLLLPADPKAGPQGAEALACPLPEWLLRTLEELAPGPDAARILKDSLPWMERYLRHGRGEQEAPEDSATLLAEAGQALQLHLKLDDAHRERLASDLEKLQAALPEGSGILAYGRYAALHLLIHAVNSRVAPRRLRFRQQIEQSIRSLKALLAVERGKSSAAHQPEAAQQSVGLGGGLFDAQALSAVMVHARGTREMPALRRERIEQALAVLESWQPAPVLIRIVYHQRPSGDWLDSNPALAAVEDAEPCIRATSEFDREARNLVEIFSAVRIAQLEADGRYDAALHDPWFESFDWEAFSQDELLLVPVVVALESADRVADAGLRGFSRLLSSGRPVQILVRVQPHNNPGAGAGENPFAAYRTELGYFGLSHRQAVVTQSSPARHQHLLDCFLAALEATRTSLHILNVGLRPPGKLLPLNAWLVAGAGIESRAHPFFRINPEAGDSAASRMDFSDNPQSEAPWPVHPFAYLDDNGHRIDTELAFTFADYALLIERLRGHFRLIPPGCDSDGLVPIQAYLEMAPDEASRRVPFVWAVDGAAQLHRVAISRALTLACGDRQNFWRSLQELAGVRNRYVERAIAATQQEERAAAAQERERLLAEHAAALAQARSTAAGEAMQRLADTLLGLDLSAPSPPLGLSRPAAAKTRASAATAAPEAGAEAPSPASAGAEEFDEPWIDTPLCTSCNDCISLNPRLFVYNEDKQALLGNLKAGTFEELVRAAEICPAHCIHPGKPQNPNEPGLEALIARAAPFNRL